MTLFSGAAAELWMRYVHYIFGVLWIGHLYYFNFSQMAFMAEADSATKTTIFQKLTPRTMFWFRWGAMFTFLSGWAMIFHRMNMGAALASAWGMIILSGGFLGTLMFLNVWLIIWPANKIAIESSGVSPGLPRAAIASRTNTLFSIPMLFFMGAASHLPITLSPEKSLMNYWIAFLVIVGLIEFNAIKGKMGMLQKIGTTVHLGIALTFALYFALHFLAGP